MHAVLNGPAPRPTVVPPRVRLRVTNLVASRGKPKALSAVSSFCIQELPRSCIKSVPAAESVCARFLPPLVVRCVAAFRRHDWDETY